MSTTAPPRQPTPGPALSPPGDWDDHTDPGVQVVDRRFVVHQPVDRCSCAVLYTGFDLAEQKPIEFFLECRAPGADGSPRMTVEEVMTELRDRFPGRGPLSAHGHCRDGRRYIVLEAPDPDAPAPVVTTVPASEPSGSRSVGVLVGVAAFAVVLLVAGIRWVQGQGGLEAPVASTVTSEALSTQATGSAAPPAPPPEPEPAVVPAAPEPDAATESQGSAAPPPEAPPPPPAAPPAPSTARSTPVPAPEPSGSAEPAEPPPAPEPVPPPAPTPPEAPAAEPEATPAPPPAPAAEPDDPYGDVDLGDDYMGVPDDYGKE